MDLKGKRVLVTGADGFIGSHLVEALFALGAKVKAFVYYNSFNSYGWLDTFKEEKLNNIEIFSGDIRDPNGVKEAVKGVDVVFHLAALIGIPFSYHSPDSFIDTNVKGTLNVLQAVRGKNIQRLIVTSTSEVYGTAKYVPIDESHPFQPQSPYSASKIGADSIAMSFYNSFNLPLTIARPFNTFGPRQSARAVIPSIIIQALSGKKEIKLGSLSPTRDLNYVTDTCNGFIELAMSDKVLGKTVNIGSGKEISIGDLTNMIFKVVGKDLKIVSQEVRVRPKRSEVERLISENSLIKSLTNWENKVSLEEGIKRTVEWFKVSKNLSKYKADTYNI